MNNRYFVKYELKKRVCEKDKAFAFSNKTYNRYFETFNSGILIINGESKKDVLNFIRRCDFLGIYKFSANECDLLTLENKLCGENSYTTRYIECIQYACCVIEKNDPVTRVVHQDRNGKYIVYKSEKYYLAQG